MADQLQFCLALTSFGFFIGLYWIVVSPEEPGDE